MKENRILFKNTLIYTIGGIGSKLCAYFLVPLYTLSMSTDDYGIADLYYLTIQIVCIVGTVKIASSLVRFVLEDKKDAKILFTASLKVITIATAIVSVVYIMLGDRYFGEHGIPVWFFPIFFFACTYREICAELTKALDHNMVYVTGGIIQSVTLLGASYFLLVKLNGGINGYIEALILANIVSILYFSIKMHMTQFIDVWLKSGPIIKSMIQYSAFLVPAALAYWVIQASDRYLINYFMGSSAAGLYSVAYKIPGICTTFSSFFLSAWYISTMHEKDNTNYYSKVFSIFFNFVMLLTTGIIVFDKVLAKILFQKDFYEAWKYAPILVAGSLFSICYSFFEVIFSTFKDTKAIFYTTAIGAIANVAMNLALIPLWGIHGATISTLASLMLVFFLRFYRICKRGYMQMHLKAILLSSFLIIALALTYCFATSHRGMLVGTEFFFIILLQRKTITELIQMLIHIRKK